MAYITAYVHSDTETGRLDFNWNRNDGLLRQYSVDRGLIAERADDVRAALQDLVEAWRAKKDTEYRALLSTVAEKGYGLYEALFTGSRSSDREPARKVKEYLAEKLNPLTDTITFHVPSAVHFPWGLIYDNPAICGGGLVDKNSFWCIKYNVSVHYELLEADGVDTVWDATDFLILFGAHQGAWNAAHPLLRDEQRNHLGDLLRPPEQPIFSGRDLVARWQRQRDRAPYGLLCFYGHASGKMLCIGNDTISHNAFAADFRRDEFRDKPPTLVFLAGCQTAIGDLDPGFLGATSKTGFCGLIGTEVKVPDVFTLGFLSRFLEGFYQGGRTIGEVMRELRAENWPLSLVFSMCCTRDLRLAPQLSPLSRPLQNLSEHTISSE